MPRLERNIYKRKDGRYEARYIKGYNEDGKALYGAVYAHSYAEVKEKRDRVKPPKRKVFVAETKRTVAEEIENYLHSSRNQIKPSTYGIYRRFLENYITPHFNDMRCSQLTAEIMQDFANRQIEKGLAVVTVQSLFCFIRKGLKSSFKQEVFIVELPKPVKTEVEVLSSDEQKRLETAARLSDDINRMSVILCLYTGVRIGELCGLTWDDIDFGRKLLHVRRTLQRIENPDNQDGANKTLITCLSPKSSTSRRSVPLPEFLLALLSEYREASDGDEYIISRNGSPIEPRTLQHRFKKLLTTANVKQINFHALRHTFSVRALENGFDIKTLSEILGHSSPVITLTKYAHCLDEHKRKCMESLTAVYH